MLQVSEKFSTAGRAENLSSEWLLPAWLPGCLAAWLPTGGRCRCPLQLCNINYSAPVITRLGSRVDFAQQTKRDPATPANQQHQPSNQPINPATRHPPRHPAASQVNLMFYPALLFTADLTIFPLAAVSCISIDYNISLILQAISLLRDYWSHFYTPANNRLTAV